MATTPNLLLLKQRPGIAGQFQIDATVKYDQEPETVVSFVGSTYGGPVVMISNGHQTYVTEPGRFGEFGKDWVRKFFGVMEL